MKSKKVDLRCVLVVDDDPCIVESISEYLGEERPDLRVVGAGDGNTALYLWEDEKPAVVVLDLMLPKRSGFMVTEKIRRESQPSGVPYIIMVTGNHSKRHEQYAMHLGVNHYMVKPIRLVRLKSEIQEGIEEVEQILRGKKRSYWD